MDKHTLSILLIILPTSLMSLTSIGIWWWTSRGLKKARSQNVSLRESLRETQRVLEITERDCWRLTQRQPAPTQGVAEFSVPQSVMDDRPTVTLPTLSTFSLGRWRHSREESWDTIAVLMRHCCDDKECPLCSLMT